MNKDWLLPWGGVDLPVVVVNPFKVPKYSQVTGQLAKTDGVALWA